MSNSSEYVPPKVWTWDTESGGRFANINRPIAGATHEKELPVGKHPLQLYSLGTPNGIKVTILLEELLALGHEGAEYDAFLINIMFADPRPSASDVPLENIIFHGRINIRISASQKFNFQLHETESVFSLSVS